MIQTIRSGYAQYSLRKIKTSGAIKGSNSHNDRFDLEKFIAENKNTSNHIDTRRSEFNHVLAGKDVINYWGEVVERVTGKKYSEEKINSMKKEDLRYADGKKVRKDAILAMEGKINYPGEMRWSKFDGNRIVPLRDDEVPKPKDQGHFLWPVDMNELKKWEEKTIKFTKERFGEDNIIQAQVHMDETTPHIHVVFTPSYKREDGTRHFSLDKIGLSNKVDWTRLQTEYSQALAGMEYVRGEVHSPNVQSYTVAEYRTLVASVLEKELPEPELNQTAKEYKEQIADPAYRMAIAHNTELEIKYETRNASAKELQKAKKKIDEQEKELQAEKEENEKLKNALSRANQSLRALEFEKRGIELAEDQDTIQSIYIPLKESLIEVGRSDYESRGFDFEQAYNKNR